MSESQMTRRERILAAIEHRPVDKVPIDFDIFEPVREGVLRYFGADCLENLYEKSGIEGFFRLGLAERTASVHWAEAGRR